MSAAVPVRNGLARAMRGTGLGVAARWRLLSTASGRAAAWFALVVALLGMTAAARLGDTVRSLAEYDPDSTAGIYALAYLRDWTTDGFGSVAALVVGFVAAVTVLAPMTAPVSPGIIPTSERAGFAFSRMSRYTDSIVTHVLSLTTVLQVLALTALASLVTVDGHHRARALLVAWGAWAVSVLGAVAVSWVTELGRRAHPNAGRWTAGTLLLAAAVAVTLDPNHGRTLFGAGPHVTAALRTAPPAAVGAVLLISGGALAAAGWLSCRAALRHGERPATRRTLRPRPMPTTASAALWSATWRTIWRTRVIRNPVVLVFVLCLTAATVLGPDPQILAGLMVVAPLMLALAWPVNSLALVGSAGAFLSSLPGTARRIVPVHAAIAWTTTFAVTTGTWLGAAARGLLSVHDVAVIVALALTTSTAYTATTTTLSVNRARPTALEANQPVLPPARTIALTLAFLLTWGLGTAVLAAGNNLVNDQDLALTHLLAGCAAITAVAGVWLLVVLRVWVTRPSVRAASLARVNR